MQITHVYAMSQNN